MKINSLNAPVTYTGQVREKQDGHGTQQDGSGEKDSESGSQSEGKLKKQRELHLELRTESKMDVSPERMDQAIQAFQSDVLSQANGLKASLEGVGPGLRVVLKDGSGRIIRQLSREEFLKLREGTSQESRTCGKILDQKL